MNAGGFPFVSGGRQFVSELNCTVKNAVFYTVPQKYPGL